MTLKEMFKKVETYNEVAEVMHTDKAVIYFLIVTTLEKTLKPMTVSASISAKSTSLKLRT